jgi:hypothetical protein
LRLWDPHENFPPEFSNDNAEILFWLVPNQGACPMPDCRTLVQS